MSYSREQLFNEIGQYDGVVTFNLRHGSESYNTYGRTITGCIIYSPKERQELQDKLDNASTEETDGPVRFTALMIDYPKNLVQSLEQHGVMASDIVSKLHRPFEGPNEFEKTDLRELPGPTLEIQIDGTEDEWEKVWMYQTLHRLSKGEKLLPFELDEMRALRLKHDPEAISDEDFKENYLDSTTGEIKDSINYSFLKSKYLAQDLSEEEETEFDRLCSKEASDKAKILVDELKRFNGKPKTLLINNPEATALLIALALSFKDEKILHLDNPVWWDFERFAHIYVRHVKEVQVGVRDKPKTMFQYQVQDIKKLVQAVLQSISNEIDDYFKQFPKQDFVRVGERSVSFNGDYYQIVINPSGKLMQFHKR